MTAGFHYAGNYVFNISRIQLIKVVGEGGGGNCISAGVGGYATKFT